MAGRRAPTPVGRAIKGRRAELTMRPSGLGAQVGTRSAYVTYLIYGDRRDGAWVARICEVLDMPTHGEDGPELTGFVHARKGSGAAGDSVVQ